MEKPILFSTEMVRALLDGRKTQTRRIIKPQPTDCTEIHKEYREADWKNEPITFTCDASGVWFCKYCGNMGDLNDKGLRCRWQAGDVLYVRETWGVGCRPDPNEGWIEGFEFKADEAFIKEGDDLPLYRNDNFAFENYDSRWRPSIHMPKVAARIWLEVTDVRVERLNEISEEDAISEGIMRDEIGYRDYDKELQKQYGHPDHDWPHWISPIDSFKSLWDSINEENNWKNNPWVWAISFKIISTTGKPV